MKQLRRVAQTIWRNYVTPTLTRIVDDLYLLPSHNSTKSRRKSNLYPEIISELQSSNFSSRKMRESPLEKVRCNTFAVRSSNHSLTLMRSTCILQQEHTEYILFIQFTDRSLTVEPELRERERTDQASTNNQIQVHVFHTVRVGG